MSVEEDDDFRESLGGAEGIPLPSQAVVSTQFRGMDTALLKNKVLEALASTALDSSSRGRVR